MLGAEFIRNHQDYGESFPEWKLYEGCRSTYNFLSKRQSLLDRFTSTMQEECDFLHGRISNSAIVQNLQHVLNAVASTLYEGVEEGDLNLLLLQLSKMCVAWMVEMLL